MSCELVWNGGDFEDKREAVTAYQNCLTGIVSAFKGFTTKRVGTTAVVYFGYPEAHENDAELAVRRRVGPALGRNVDAVFAFPT